MTKLRITQIKSLIGSDKRQKANMRNLGIRRMQQTVEVEKTPSVMGQVERVRHLLKIEEIN